MNEVERLRLVTAGAIIVGPLLFGGYLPWAVGILGLVALTLAYLVFTHDIRNTGGQHRGMPAFVVALVALAIFTLLQRLPLPVELIGWLNPETLKAQRAMEAALGLMPIQWMPLSRDPGNTGIAAVGWGYVAVVALSSYRLASVGQRAFILHCIALSGITLSSVTLMHVATGASRVYGLYTPQHATEAIGPLLNRNHVSAMALLTGPLVASLALEATSRRKRVRWLCGLALLIVTSAFSLSRGGVIQLTVSLFLFLGSAWWLRRKNRDIAGEHGAGRLRPIFVTTTISIALAGVLFASALSQEFVQGNEKLDAIQQSTSILAIAPAGGIGRGAFSQVYTALAPGLGRRDHPENLLVQWLAEWGLAVTLMWIAVLLWSGVRLIRSIPDTHAIAVAIAFPMMLVHDLADFSLELPGIAAVWAALPSSGLRPRFASPSPSWKPTTLARSSDERIVVASALQLAIALGLLFASGLRPSNHWSALALLDEGKHDPAEFSERLEEVLRLHPSDAGIALIGASVTAHYRRASAGRLLNLSMSLAPKWPEPHRIAAIWLADLGHPHQAAIELHETADRQWVLAADTFVEIFSELRAASDVTMDTYELARLAAPNGPHRGAFLDRVSRRSGGRLRTRLDAQLREERYPGIGPWLRELRRLRTEDAAAAAAGLGREGMTVLSSSLDGPELDELRWSTALALQDAGEDAEALAYLGPPPADVERRRGWLQTAATLAATATGLERLDGYLGELERLARGNPEALADMLEFEANLRRQLGQWTRAVDAWERLARIRPNPPDIGRALAQAERAGARNAARRLRAIR